MGNRYLEHPLNEHLQKLRQMVFITGPRQCGKTTLAKKLLGEVFPKENYFNWDLPDHRKFLLTQIFPGHFRLDQENQKRICFDEIHKYKRWKNTLKGLFDHYEPKHSHWIVTGSALLNVYRRGQDSLLGRHFTYHLFPFSIAECASGTKKDQNSLGDILKYEFTSPATALADYQESILELTGFPEPLFSGSKSFLSRWRTNRLDRLIQQDLMQTEQIKNLSLVENLVALLPSRVGNPLSINSLREDLEVHFTTVKHWIDLLERIFYLFRIRCYSKKLPRLMKKESKIYLWDWSEIEEPGLRFENMVAMHLLKFVFFQNDLGLADLSLHYLKDRYQREVDFLICDQKKPVCAIECKLSDTNPSPQLIYFARALGISKCFLVVKNLKSPKTLNLDHIQIEVVPSASFLGLLV